MAHDDSAAPTPWARRVLAVTAALALLVVLTLAGVYLSLRASFESEPSPEGLPPAATATGLLDVFPKQGPNQCGAYSLAFAMRARGEDDVDPAGMVDRVSHRVSWSEALSGTLPWKLSAELEARGFSGRQLTASGLSTDRRLDLLRGHLAEGAPVLVLIESERRTQHYVLVVGYAADRIDVYDPNAEADAERPEQTRDLNGGLPGNLSLDPATFADQWSRGGGGGLYRWWYVPIVRVTP
jgi:hypothetical protein